jgi:hypothetical protein
MVAPLFIRDVSSRRYAEGLLSAAVRPGELINISYLTRKGASLYSDASDDGRGDLRQLAPRKTCAKPLESFRRPATV